MRPQQYHYFYTTGLLRNRYSQQLYIRQDTRITLIAELIVLRYLLIYFLSAGRGFATPPRKITKQQYIKAKILALPLLCLYVVY